VRLIAATNRDLEAEVHAGRFRQDLFFRLAVVRLYVPPLRERADDIEPLAQSFASLAGLPDVPPDVLTQLKARSWPGNVRELVNAIQSYAALGQLPATARRQSGLDQELRETIDLRRPYADLKDELTDRFTALYLAVLLGQTGGNQSEAARIAGLSRGYLGRLLVKHGLARVSAAPDARAEDERDDRE